MGTSAWARCIMRPVTTMKPDALLTPDSNRTLNTLPSARYPRESREEGEKREREREREKERERERRILLSIEVFFFGSVWKIWIGMRLRVTPLLP